MQIKEMREVLKDQVETVPRSNTDVEAMYNKLHGTAVDVPSGTGEEWTYIGAGHTPPHMTNYMGLQVFVRGQPVMVTDQRILAKIGGNASFVKGKADMEEVFKNDELMDARVQKIREHDQALQITVERQNRKG